MQLFVGLSAHRGSIKRYPFDILEMPISATLPKPRTLRDMRASRPEVRFSLRLAPEVVAQGPSHPDVARTIAARDALGAAVIVIPSGPRFSPTERNRKFLSELVAQLRSDDCHVAWEPRGVFSAAQAQSWAEDVGAILVRDLTREARSPGEVVYTRLLPFGYGARVSQTASEVLAEQLEGATTAYVIVGGEGAKATRTRLREWLSLGVDEQEFDEDDEEEELDQEEDEQGE